MTARICNVAGCDRVTRKPGSEMCDLHYSRLRNRGTTDAPAYVNSGHVCLIEGCGNPSRRKGLCEMHGQRVKKHGDPTFEFRADNNHQWTGDAATYFAIHQRLRKTRGPARAHVCAFCGMPARQWAYDHTDPNERTSDVGPYSTDLERYQPACVPCHKASDLAHLRMVRSTVVAS